MGSKIAGGVLLLVGGALLAQAISAGAERGVVLGGPTLAPIIVTAIWVVVALIYIVGQFRPASAASASPAESPEVVSMDTGVAVTQSGPAADPAVPFRWRTPFLVLATLVGYALVLKYTLTGYVLATALFFLITARLLSTRPLREVIVRDISVAIGLSLGIYLAFTRLLGIVLPAGVLPL